jgi:DNA-binding transcriptional regulator YiaG
MIAIGYHQAVTGNGVRRVRHRLGLTQAQFAKQLGVHKVTVAKWEAGMRSPRGAATTLIRLLATTVRNTPARRSSGFRRSR